MQYPKRTSEYMIISLIFISFAGSLMLIFFNQGLWWDEAVYLALGNSIKSGYYSLEPGTTLEIFRPFLLPAIISPLSDSVLLSRILVWLISVLSVILLYSLARQILGKETALWSALLLSTSYLFIFFGSKVLTEPLFIALFLLSLIFFTKGEGGQHRFGFILLAGVFAGMAFLTRYLAVILFASYAVFYAFQILRSRKAEDLKKSAALLAGIMLALIPWFLLNYSYYGDPTEGFSANLYIYSGESQTLLSQGINDLLFSLGASSLLFIGLFVLFRKRELFSKPVALIFLVFSLSLAFYLLTPHKETRYILTFYPVYAILCSIGVSKLDNVWMRNTAKTIVFLIAIYTVAFSFQSMWDDRHASDSIIRASMEIKNLTSPGDTVMTHTYPYIYYIADRSVVLFPGDPTDIPRLIEENNIKYVFVFSFELRNPDYVAAYFSDESRFRKIRSYEQWKNPEASIIYEVI